jgi:ferritin-like metal-binding protein YciE
MNTTTKNQNSTTEKKVSETENNSQNNKRGQQSLRRLFEKEMQDIYDAEKQLVLALPEMAKAAFDEDLEEAFLDHLEQTKKHVERLDKIFSKLGMNKSEEKCIAMIGLITEGQKVINEMEASPVRDSALIISAQKIEHYEIASYGSLSELADVLGLLQVGNLLDRTLEEEEDTDALLTEIAEEINDEAADQEE